VISGETLNSLFFPAGKFHKSFSLANQCVSERSKIDHAREKMVFASASEISPKHSRHELQSPPKKEKCAIAQHKKARHNIIVFWQLLCNESKHFSLFQVQIDL
jgi:hypothetical protein